MLNSVENKHLKNAVTYAPVGIAIVDREGHWKWVNPKLCELLGYSEAEMTDGLTWMDITPDPKEREYDLKMVQKVINGEIPFYTMEKTYRTRSKREINCKLTVLENRDNDEFMFFWSFVEPVFNLDPEYLAPSPRNPKTYAVDSTKLLIDLLKKHWLKIGVGIIMIFWTSMMATFALGKAYEKIFPSQKQLNIPVIEQINNNHEK